MTIHVYIVSYDIADDKRRQKVYQLLRGWGDHLQYSVFRVLLSSTQRTLLETSIHPLLHHTQDQVLIFDLGPVDGGGGKATTSIGLLYTHPNRHATVV